MLDKMDSWQTPSGETERHRKLLVHVAHLSQVACAIDDVRETHPIRDCERGLAEEIGLWIATDSDVGHVSSADLSDFKAALDTFAGKPGPVLDPAKSFFFDGDYQLSVTNEYRRAIGVIGIDSEYVHPLLCQSAGLFLLRIAA